MELTTKITLDMLTKNSVSVLKQQFITLNNVEMQVGGNIRNTYMNDTSGRKIIQNTLSQDYQNAVFAVWGVDVADTSTVEDGTEVSY